MVVFGNHHGCAWLVVMFPPCCVSESRKRGSPWEGESNASFVLKITNGLGSSPIPRKFNPFEISIHWIINNEPRSTITNLVARGHGELGLARSTATAESAMEPG